MFRRVRNPASKGVSVEQDFFVSAEFHKSDGKEDAFGLAVTDCTDAWISVAKGDDFKKLMTNSRLGSLEIFRNHTVDAFASAEDDRYVVETKLSSDGEQMDVKWKLRESGISKVIGHVQLFRASSPADVISRILSAVLSHVAVGEYACKKLERQTQDVEEATTKLRELAERPDMKEAIVERTVEILNDAKRRNRELGGSTEGFQEAWELATQVPTTSAMDTDLCPWVVFLLSVILCLRWLTFRYHFLFYEAP